MSFQEYNVGQIPWRVERYDLLAAAFVLADPDRLPDWHRSLDRQGRAWDVVRRRYGVYPVLGTDDVEHMMAHDEPKVGTLLGMKEAEVRALLQQAVATWKRFGVSGETKPGQHAPVQEEMAPDEIEELLALFSFIEVVGDDRKQYLARRIRELQPVLGTADARAQARGMLFSEMTLVFDLEAQIRDTGNRVKQLRKLISEAKAGEDGHDKPETIQFRQELERVENRHDKHLERHTKIQESIQETSKALGLDEMQAVGQGKKIEFRDCIGQMIEAVRIYQSEEDNSLIDTIHTSGDVLILTEPYGDRKAQYRVDLAMLSEGYQQTLWLPEGRVIGPNQKAKRRLYLGFREGVARALSEEGFVVTDLDDSQKDVTEQATSLPAELQGPDKAAASPASAAAVVPSDQVSEY